MKTMTSVLTAAIMAVIMFMVVLSGAALMQAQDSKPAPAVDRPSEFKMSDLSEVDALKMQNLLLRMNNVAKDIQTLQNQFDTMAKTEWPTLIKNVRTSYKLPESEWDFDPNTMVFKQTKKPDPAK